MRITLHLGLLALLASGLFASAACAQSYPPSAYGASRQSYPSSGYGAYGPAAPPTQAPAAAPSGAVSNPHGQIQTPDRAGSANVPSAATAPLHDLNITRQPIPPILLAAITNPYDPPQPRSCREIAHQVGELEVALGADFDEPDTPQSPSLTKKSGHVALTLLHGASEMLLPYAGFVRTLSGAQRHDQLVIEAITAGSARRAYLKGVGESLRCRPPAAPVHFLRPPPPAHEESLRPKYPID